MSRWKRPAAFAVGAPVLALAIVLAGPLSAAAPGHLALAGTGGYPVTTTDPQTPATEVANVPITMSDGVVLEADEYVPTTCTAAAKCPVVLIQTPYRKGASSTPGDFGSAAAEAIPYLDQHGYIEVVVDVRGTGSSEGFWDSFGPREQQDGAELVQWVADAAHVPQSNGEVALAGVSYSGINQLLTVEAIQRDIRGSGPLAGAGSSCTSTATFDCANPTGITTDPVKAIFPIVSSADVYRDVTYAGGNVDSGFIPLWLGLVNGLGVMPPDTTGTDPAVALNAESQHLEDLGMFAAPAVAAASLGAYESVVPAQITGQYTDQAYDSTFYTVRSPITDIADVEVPTFLVGGTYDLFQRGEPILYNAIDVPATLGSPAETKKLVVGPWYHVTEGSGLTADNGSDPVTDDAGAVIPSIDNLELAWFDRWVKGTANGIQAFPSVETYRLGTPGGWHQDTRYPSTGTVGQRWYLGAAGAAGATLTPSASGGTLTRTAPAGASTAVVPTVSATGTCSRSTWQWTAGLPAEVTEPSPVCEADSTATEAQGLSFTSAPFASPYTLSGPIEADLYVSSTAPDSTVVATLADVSGSSASDITAGTLVASMRQVTAAPCATVVLGCSVYLPDATTGVSQSIEPWHPYTRASQQSMQPGTVYELRVEIFPTSATLAKGHRLRVTLTTSDAPHEMQTLSTTAGSAGVDTLWCTATYPSSVYLGTTTP